MNNTSYYLELGLRFGLRNGNKLRPDIFQFKMDLFAKKEFGALFERWRIVGNVELVTFGLVKMKQIEFC